MRLPEWLARPLRRAAGPDPVLTARLMHARAEVAAAEQRAEAERQKCHEAGQRAHERQVEIDRLASRLAKALNVEPGPAEGCVKVRLRDRDEAWEFARRVAADTGQDLGRFHVYPCKICPRQPVGVGRFLHITNAQGDTARSEARKRRAGQRNRDGSSLADRLDPEAVARLRVD